MTDITLNTATVKSVIHCGSGAFAKYAPALSHGQNFIVTDTNVFGLYKKLIYDTFGKDVNLMVLPAGEKSKTHRNLIEIIKVMAQSGMTRGCRVIAFGGGVVGDIAGLVASLYMRGVHLVQIPTTLLSQVDSSVGGKTAVDFGNVKNLIGTFYQPEEVIVDSMFLSTLPAREIRCGLGEIIKYGALDKDIYQKLLSAADIKDLAFLGEITPDCINHKAKVVIVDERDINGARKTLNLGHTTGHALELFYKRKSHGEYVLIGTYYELFIANKLGICGGEYCDNLIKLINSVIKNIPAYEDIQSAAQLAKLDKKNAADSKISLIVPKCEGESTEVKLDVKEYAKYLTECAKSLKK